MRGVAFDGVNFFYRLAAPWRVDGYGVPVYVGKRLEIVKRGLGPLLKVAFEKAALSAIKNLFYAPLPCASRRWLCLNRHPRICYSQGAIPLFSRFLHCLRRCSFFRCFR